MSDALPRFTFVQRFPNGGYNSYLGDAGHSGYNNPSMPNYVPAGAQGISGGGKTFFYDVVDGGVNTFNGQNTAGGAGSGSTTPVFKSAGAMGQVVGRIIWDAVMQKWNFIVKDGFDLALPDTSDGQSDAAQIKNFINGLNGTSTLGGNPPAVDLVNDATSVNLGGQDAK